MQTKPQSTVFTLEQKPVPIGLSWYNIHLPETRAIPLTPEELIPDIALRALAKGDPARQLGEISPQDQSVLAMYLPDICGELMAYRALARKGAI